MPESSAELLVRAVLGYLVLGLLFAAGFAFRWSRHLDAAAAAGTPGFRMLLLPGATLLWPWLIFRLVRAPGRSAP